ncbi:MAG: Ig-like domain-containing protein, partial [Acholeplasma sp.]
MKSNKIKKILILITGFVLTFMVACTSGETSIEATSVLFTEDNITLNLGENYQLQAVISPEDATDKTLEFGATTEFFTVSSSGLVEALAVGTGTAWVKTTNGMTDTITITIIDESDIPVENIILSISTLQLYVDDTYQITATIIPYNATDKRLSYESNNTDVANISQDGIVTALSVGEATMTIRSTSNVTTNLNVIVSEKQSALTSNTLGNSDYGFTYTAGFNLTHADDENPYVETNNSGEQRIYFESFDRIDYIVSTKIKSKNTST